MKLHRGFTLVELLIVLSVASAMLLVATSVLYLLKQAQTSTHQRLAVQRSVTRLARQFREDVHRAGAMERLPKPLGSPNVVTWSLAMEGGVAVNYELRTGSLRRVQTADTTRRHEDFRLPPGTEASMVGPAAETPWATFRLDVTDPTVAKMRPVQVEAVLGLDRPHTAQGEETGK
jgi:prepilin-type N-terminal cleavage/methylation domain-containing protein